MEAGGGGPGVDVCFLGVVKQNQVCLSIRYDKKVISSHSAPI